MKADSGSWLYILLSIVFLVLSAIGNKNKKKPTVSTPPVNDDYEPPVSSPERKWPKSLEDVLTEVLDLPKQQEVVAEKKESVPREEYSAKSYEKIEDEAQSLETIDEEIFSYETPVDDKKKEQSKLQPPKVIKKENPEEKQEPVLDFHAFNLREGIIYAEILNRKYF